jgi:hypothetical protein
MGKAFSHAIVLSAAGLLAGCGSPDVAACEEFIKGTLDTPATYKRADVRIIDEPNLELARYLEQTGLKPPATEAYRVIRDIEVEQGLGLRRLVILFDADNAYGTPIRRAQTCAFKLDGGRVSETDLSITSAQAAAAMERLRSMGELPVGAESSLKFPCCLSPGD